MHRFTRRAAVLLFLSLLVTLPPAARPAGADEAPIVSGADSRVGMDPDGAR